MILHKWIYLIGERIRNPKIRMHYKHLLSSDKMTNVELEKLQLKHLKKLLFHAQAYSPYYTTLLKHFDIQNMTLGDIEKLPILTKETLRKELKNIQNNPTNDKVFKSSTSGSSGQSLLFTRNLDWDAAARAAQLRGYKWHGVAPWMKNLYFWGFNTNLLKLIPIRIFDFLVNRKRIFSYDHKTFEKLKPFLHKADYIEGYSSAIFTMSEYYEKNNQKFPNIKMVKGTSEKIYEAYQKPINNVFHKKMISEYGAAETGIIAFECPEGNMHIAMENVLVEEVEDKILVTNLFSYSVPIIRYDLGDYIVLDKTTKCQCGRGHYIIKEITGRIGTNIKGSSKEYPSLYLYYVFKNISLKYNIDISYQATQDKIGVLNFNIIYNASIKNQKKVYELILLEVEKLFNKDIICHIEFSTSIEHTNKKTQAFTSNL